MSSYREKYSKASKTAQRKIAETEKTAFQFQNEFAKTFEEMSQAVILRVRAETELGVLDLGACGKRRFIGHGAGRFLYRLL